MYAFFLFPEYIVIESYKQDFNIFNGTRHSPHVGITLSHVMRKLCFLNNGKTRRISAQSLYFLNPKFQASSHLLWPYSPVCGRTGQKPQRQVFSQSYSIRFPHLTKVYYLISKELLQQTINYSKTKLLSQFVYYLVTFLWKTFLLC